MKKTASDPSYLRQLNSAAILKVLYQRNPRVSSGIALGPVEELPCVDGVPGLTIREVAAEVNVSRPTADDAVDDLLALGWLEELTPDDTKARSAGRPARRIRFRADAGFVVGVDVERYSVSTVVANLSGTVVARSSTEVSVNDSAERRLVAINQSIDDSLASAGAPKDRVLGTAVGATGIVDPSGDVLLSQLPGWTGIHLASEMSRMLAAPVKAQNHLRLIGVSERWCGAAQNSNNVVHLHAGQRMGLGLLVDGTMVQGFRGAAGELSAPSAQKWIRAYDTLLQHPLGFATGRDRMPGDVAAGDARQIFDAAAQGDASAVTAVKRFVRDLIAGIEPIFALLNPELVVIGGDLAHAGSAIIEPVRRQLESICPIPPSVAVSQLGEDAILLGAIRVALDIVETRLFEEHRLVELGPVNAGLPDPVQP